MNVLINFSTLKAGGGQNVAMNFLYKVFDIKPNDINLFFLVAKNSSPHKFLQERYYKNFFVVDIHPLKRIYFEIFKSKILLEKWNIDIIYTYFGYGLFPKQYKQVSGVAVSNLFFPEIDSWEGYPIHIKLKKKKILKKY